MSSLHVVSLLLVISSLLVILELDRRQREIFLVPVLILAVAGAFHAWFFRHENLPSLILGCLIGCNFFGLQYLVSKKRLVGVGDIWLGAALGLVFGWSTLLFVLLLAYVGGAVISLVLVVVGRIQRQDPLPLGSFLAGASICVLLMPASWIWFGIWPLGSL